MYLLPQRQPVSIAVVYGLSAFVAQAQHSIQTRSGAWLNCHECVACQRVYLPNTRRTFRITLEPEHFVYVHRIAAVDHLHDLRLLIGLR